MNRVHIDRFPALTLTYIEFINDYYIGIENYIDVIKTISV